MKENELRQNLERILGADLTYDEFERLKGIIREEGIDPENMDDLVRLSGLLDIEARVSEESSMDKGFYSMLEKEKAAAFDKQSIKGNRTWLRIAAGIALFISGWIGSQLLDNQTNSQILGNLSEELAELKETLVLTKLEQDSPSERIQAVNMVRGMGSLDEALAISLLAVLNNDPNTNVRLLALETLVTYSDNPLVREGMIKAIANQVSPVVQLRLAEIMTDLQEKSSVSEFQKILDDLTLDYSVREQINETVKVLL